jgi:hypothetical protein
MTADMTTIEEVLDRLAAVCDEAIRTNDRVGYFAALYRQVTLQIAKGIAAGVFEDGPRMSRFDAHFGSRYFRAFDGFRQPAEGVTIPRCWQVAFEAGRDQIAVVQHLILGINAHINLDLAGAAADTSPEAIDSLHRDYLTVNTILTDTLDKIQGELDQISPVLKLVDFLGGQADERILSWIVRESRDAAWHWATVLAGQTDADRLATTAELDGAAELLAKGICHLPPGAAELIRLGEKTDIAEVIEAIGRATADSVGNVAAVDLAAVERAPVDLTVPDGADAPAQPA